MNTILAAVIAAGVLGGISLPGFASEEKISSLSAPDSAAELLTQAGEEDSDDSDNSELNDDGFLIEQETFEADTAGEEVPQVEFYLRLSTEIFRYGDDNVEFHLPIRYTPTDRLNLEVAPFMKFQPEDDEHDLDYGVRAAVEYRL